MFKSALITVLGLLLGGCQFQSTINPITATQSCRIDSDTLRTAQLLETRFLQQPQQRSTILQAAIRDKDRPLLALLLSTPFSSTSQLQQAKKHFAKIVLYPDEACPGDRYLALRDEQTSALLWLRAEQDKLLKENKQLSAAHQALKVKIDALTEIEAELSQQRGEQP